MRRPGALFLVVCALVLVPVATAATESRPPTAVGYWAGTVDMPQGPLDFKVTLAQDEAGWAGRIDIPMQGIHGLALEEISVAGQTVQFGMSGVHGDPRFSGHLAADGGSIAGTFNHVGRDHAFALSRSDSPPADLGKLFAGYIEPGVPGEGLAGHWRGVMEAGISKLRVEMTITTGEDGTLSGAISSPDQGSMEMTISSATVEGEKVTFNVGTVYGLFDGFLVDEGAALVGHWTQGRIDFPIGFNRQAEPSGSTGPGGAVSGN